MSKGILKTLEGKQYEHIQPSIVFFKANNMK